MYADVVLGCKPEDEDEPDPFEELLDRKKKAKGAAFDTDLTADDLKELVAEFKAAALERTGSQLPRGPARAALGRRLRRLRLLGQRSRHRLPPPLRHPRHVGHCRERADHGLRQHRRGLRHRRRLHAQSRQRREHVLRRVPGERPGRGRGRRRAHAAPGQRAQGGVARGLRRAHGDPEDAGARAPRHAGLRVHHRARPPLHAADAQRQAHRPRGHPHRRRHGRRGAHHPGRGHHAHRAGAAQPAPAAHLLAGRQAARRRGRPGPGQGPARRPRRGHRPRRVQRAGRGGLGRARRAGAAGPRLHEPGGHPRHDRRPRASSRSRAA